MKSQESAHDGIMRDLAPGMACTGVEIAGQRLAFAVGNPRKGETFVEQATDVIETVKRFVETNGVAVVRLSVFLADFADRVEFRRLAADCFGEELPVVTYIPQRPCGGSRLAVEIWGVQRGRKALEIERIDDVLTAVRCEGCQLFQYTEHFNAPVDKPFPSTVSVAFRMIEERLAACGCRLEDVIRTWFFLGDINVLEDGEPRYEQLNSVRAEVYRDRRFAAERLPSDWNAPVFPASTGVGADGADLTVSCLAVTGELPGFVMFPLENPLQTPAYEYDDRYGEQSPKFARAMTLLHGDLAITFISGTASITTSDSKHSDSIERQTHQTLDNIAALVSADNFRRHGFPAFGATLDNLLSARVYLKRAEDFEQVRAICRDRLGDLPVLYLVCDICRPELLVEIEGVTFVRRR